MGACFSSSTNLSHPRDKSKWDGTARASKQGPERKWSRPRGATIGGAHPHRKSNERLRSIRQTSEDQAQELHQEQIDEAEQEENIRKSLSEDSLTKKLDKQRVLL